MHHNDHCTRGCESDRQIAIFVCGVLGVEESQSQRIGENGHCCLKRNTVLPQIYIRFVGVPVKWRQSVSRLWEHNRCDYNRVTVAVTEPPPNIFEFKNRPIGGFGSPLGSPPCSSSGTELLRQCSRKTFPVAWRPAVAILPSRQSLFRKVHRSNATQIRIGHSTGRRE